MSYLSELLTYDVDNFLVTCVYGEITVDYLNCAEHLFDYAIAVLILENKFEHMMHSIKNIDVNFLYPSKMTLLHYAAYAGNLNVVDFLLDRGASMLAVNIYDQTPVNIVAGELYHHMTTGRLLNKISLNDLTTVTYILNSVVDISVTDNNNNGVLHYAIANSTLEMIKLLLAHDADINARNNDGNTVLHLSIMLLKPESDIEYLLYMGADPNLTNYIHGYSALEYAIASQKLPYINLLFTRKINVDRVNKYSSPLHEAVKTGNPKIFATILARCGKLNLVDLEGNTVLHVSCSLGYMKISSMLIDAGSILHAINKKIMTPLHYAATNFHSKVYDLLIQRGANQNTQDINGLTAKQIYDRNTYQRNQTLLSGIITGLPCEKIKELIKAGYNINCVDNDGNTPLHLAIIHKRHDLMQFLLSWYKNINLINNNGETPLHLVENTDHLLTMIEQSEINVNIPDMDGNLPITRAAMNANLPVYKIFAKHISKATYVANRKGWTFAHYVALNNWFTEYQEIYTNGHLSSLCMNNRLNISTLNIALDNGFYEIVKFHDPKFIIKKVKNECPGSNKKRKY